MLFLFFGASRVGNDPAPIMGYHALFPHIHRIEHAPGLSREEKKAAAAIAKRIGDNTGLRCSYNSLTGSLFFHYDPEPHGGPFSVPFKEKDENFVYRYSDEEIGDWIKIAKLGQLTRQEKDEITERNKKAEEYEKSKASEAFKDERRPCVNDYAAYRDRARRGVEKVISA